MSNDSVASPPEETQTEENFNLVPLFNPESMDTIDVVVPTATNPDNALMGFIPQLNNCYVSTQRAAQIARSRLPHVQRLLAMYQSHADNKTHPSDVRLPPSILPQLTKEVESSDIKLKLVHFEKQIFDGFMQNVVRLRLYAYTNETEMVQKDIDAVSTVDTLYQTLITLPALPATLKEECCKDFVRNFLLGQEADRAEAARLASLPSSVPSVESTVLTADTTTVPVTVTDNRAQMQALMDQVANLQAQLDRSQPLNQQPVASAPRGNPGRHKGQPQKITHSRSQSGPDAPKGGNAPKVGNATQSRRAEGRSAGLKRKAPIQQQQRHVAANKRR